MSRSKGSLHPGGTPARILDALETDGGWLTADGIAERLTINPETAHRALYRLRARGLVVSHQVVLAFASDIGGKYDGYSEWRLA